MVDDGGGANATLDGGLDSPSLADTCILVSICLMGTEVMMVAPGGDAVSPAKTQACQVPRFSGAGWRRHGAGMDGPCISPTLLVNNAMSSAPWDAMLCVTKALFYRSLLRVSLSPWCMLGLIDCLH
jgi:hypothetical protein